MSARDHHVVGHAPDYSARHHAFRHFDGTPDWRHTHPAWQPPRSRVTVRQRLKGGLRRASTWALDFIHPDPRERRIIYTYLLVGTWIVMIVIGVLAKHGIHP